MKHIRTLLTLVLALCLLLPAALAAESAPGYDYGDKVADFTLTTTDGETLTLSGLLEEKKAVMLNFWFASCSPCRMEFPYMEAAWQKYQDDVALIAVNPIDSEADIAAYKAEMGLTFPMAADTAGLSSLFTAGSFPTTVIIDRNGVFCYFVSGSMPSEYNFRKLFEAYTAEDYADPLLGYVIPAPVPEEPMPATEEIAAALGSEGIVYSGVEGGWPWLLKDGVLVSGNGDAGVSQALLHMDFTAEAGDALVFEYRVSASEGLDQLTLEQNGQVHKCFATDLGWQTYAWAVPEAGAQRATFRFAKTTGMPAGENAAMLRSVKLLSGEEAAAALAANPAYPTPLEGSGVSLEVTGPEAKEILIDDPYGLMLQIVGMKARTYIAPGDVQLTARIGPGVDPETAFFYDGLMRSIRVLAGASVEGDSFRMTGREQSINTTGQPFSVFFLYPTMDATTDEMAAALVFPDEAHANAFLGSYIEQATGGAIPGLAWTYAAPAEATYRIVFVDETGAPLSGVIVNVCDEDACLPLFSGEDGSVTFTRAPKCYDLHVISAPEGVAFDPDKGYLTDEKGGEMTITLQKK